jgi:hypothetical protein
MGLTTNKIPVVSSDVEHWFLLEKKRNKLNIIGISNSFKKRGLWFILFKGWSIARYYPSGKNRQYNDIDLAVTADDFAKADKLRHSEELKHCRIDLHNELRDLDTLPWETIFERTQIVKIGDTDIRVLCPEDHLRVLVSHWLMDGGEFRHRLWDFYYLIEATRNTFDWELCFRDVPANRREWVECVVGLTHKYLGLNIDGLPFADRVRELPKWLVHAVEREWEDGVPQRPILTTLNKPAEFLRQFKKRIRPNPLRAVVDMEGSFYRPRLFYYRVGSFFKRFAAMIKRIGTVISNR